MGSMANTTIQVPSEVRDHLAALAAERGTTIGQLVAALADREPTADQLDARAAATRAVLREHMNCTLTDEDFARAPNLLDRVYQVAADESRKRRQLPAGNAA
jgi:predicted DNA-binding ribbon-helix-helix protein